MGVPVVPLVKSTTASSPGAGSLVLAPIARRSGEQGGRPEHRVETRFGRRGGVGGPDDADRCGPGRLPQDRQLGRR